VSFAHGEKPTFSEKGIWPQPAIFNSSARIWPLLMFAQDGSKATAYKAVEGTECVMMGVLEVSKPAFDGRIYIGYDLLDTIATCSASL
jgi:hypothetical protein